MDCRPGGRRARPWRWYASMLAGALLAGCGGGGSAGSAIPPPGTTFPLQSAVASLLGAGYLKNATVSGSASYQGSSYPISGSLTLSATPMTTTTTLFAGQPAVFTTIGVQGSVSVAGQTLAISSDQQVYFAAGLLPLGYQATGQYCVATSPGSYPATVQLGDSASIVHYDCYTDSSMSVAQGSVSLSYRVGTAYSTTTATVSLIEVGLDATGQQVFSETDNYVISTGGALDLASASATEVVSGIALSMQLAVS